jgi:AraC family transcriptional regulator, transcriptional activator of pobA
MDRSRDRLNNPNILAAPEPMSSTPPLPAFALYGETTFPDSLDGLHIESIAARSRLHDWEIRPHLHAMLFQILYIRHGRAALTLDAGTRPLQGPCVVAVPAMAVHGFRFDERVDGRVITLSDAMLPRLLADAAGLRERLAQPCCLPLQRGSPDARGIDQACALLQAEYTGDAAWRSRALDVALLRLLLCLGRALPPPAAHDAGAPPRTLDIVQRYRALVDAQYRQQPPLTQLATAVGVSATHLNRACRRLLDRPALAVLHARILLEAQRELAYTAMSIKQIGLGLGFDDAGYFTRFFRRGTGSTPSQWRAAAHEPGPFCADSSPRH